MYEFQVSGGLRNGPHPGWRKLRTVRQCRSTIIDEEFGPSWHFFSLHLCPLYFILLAHRSLDEYTEGHICFLLTETRGSCTAF